MTALRRTEPEMTGVELLQNGIGRTLGFLGRAGAMISITLLSRAEDEPEYQIHNRYGRVDPAERRGVHILG